MAYMTPLELPLPSTIKTRGKERGVCQQEPVHIYNAPLPSRLLPRPPLAANPQELISIALLLPWQLAQGRGGHGDDEAAASVAVRGGRGGGGTAGGQRGGGGDHLAEAPSAPVGGVGGAVVRRVRGGAVGRGRVVPALRRGAVPVHPRRVQLRQVRPARQELPQVPVAARPAMRTAKVRFFPPCLAGDEQSMAVTVKN